MPIQYASGLPYPRVSDPPTVYTANDRGLYIWNAFRAIFATDNGSDILRTVSGSTSDILLFTSDIPATLTASAVAAGNVVTQYTVLSNSLQTSILASQSGGAAGVSASAYGQVFTGYAGSAFNVPCSGYAATNGFSSYTFATGEVYNIVDCLANSNSVVSPIGNNAISLGSGATATSEGVTPIILLNTNYTQAILDNNNIISYNNRSCLVVGLYRAN
jgi:hypothetical protein